MLIFLQKEQHQKIDKRLLGAVCIDSVNAPHTAVPACSESTGWLVSLWTWIGLRKESRDSADDRKKTWTRIAHKEGPVATFHTSPEIVSAHMTARYVWNFGEDTNKTKLWESAHSRNHSQHRRQNVEEANPAQDVVQTGVIENINSFAGNILLVTGSFEVAFPSKDVHCLYHSIVVRIRVKLLDKVMNFI